MPPPPQFINLGSYLMKGSELSVRQALTQAWTLFAGLTLLDPSIDNLPYAPQKALSFGLNGQAGTVRIAFDMQHQSELLALSQSRNAGTINTQRIDGFSVANVRVAYPVPALGKKGEVFLAMENLFDRSYAYRPGYPMPGRWSQIGLSASL